MTKKDQLKSLEEFLILETEYFNSKWFDGNDEYISKAPTYILKGIIQFNMYPDFKFRKKVKKELLKRSIKLGKILYE